MSKVTPFVILCPRLQNEDQTKKNRMQNTVSFTYTSVGQNEEKIKNEL